MKTSLEDDRANDPLLHDDLLELAAERRFLPIRRAQHAAVTAADPEA